MSDIPPTDDPVREHLLHRAAELRMVIDDATARLEEIKTLLATFSDGRTRVRRRLKEVPVAPDAPQMNTVETPPLARDDRRGACHSHPTC